MQISPLCFYHLLNLYANANSVCTHIEVIYIYSVYTYFIPVVMVSTVKYVCIFLHKAKKTDTKETM